MGQLSSLIQPSFAAGEISPSLYGRTDLAKYRAGAAVMHNFFAQPYGGASTRPGTAIVGRCKQPYGTKPRNIDFQFNTLQTYILEFGQQYMRVIMDGGYVLEPAKVITAATAATPAVFTIAAHGYAVGDWVFPFGMTGNWSVLNGTPGYMWIIATTPTVNTFTVTDLDGNAVTTALLGAYPGAASVARIFTLTTPYQAIDLPLLKYVQSADVMTLTHPAYAPRYLTRSAHYVWTLTSITFASAVQAPTSISAAAINNVGADPQLDYIYIATAVTDAPYEESVPCAPFGVTNKALNQNAGVNNTITIVAPGSGPAPDRYNIYRSSAVSTGQPTPTVFGYVGQTLNLSWIDNNFLPDFSNGPPTHEDPFSGANYPACSTYNEGRQWFAAPYNFPQTMYATQVDNYRNMDVHSPIRADDAITVTLTSRQVNAIKHLMSTTALLALTSGGAWLIDAGSQSDAITPTSIRAKPQSFNGCSDVPPLSVGDVILYVQALASKVRGIGYDFYQNIFKGNDLSVLSSHLFTGYEIQEWCYCEEPYYLINAIRDDGAMLCFTYLKEQDVYAWSRWDSIGDSGTDKFRSVASIPEDAENVPYAIVERRIPGVNSGNPVYYQERFASRNFYVNGVADVKQAWCVDAGVRHDGAPVSTITGLQHLAGATVAILADGSTMTPREVSAAGVVTLDAAASVVLVGLPYECDLQTLRLDVGEPSVQGKRKKVSRVNLIVQDTRGLQISPSRQLSNGDIRFDQYTEIKERSTQPYGDPIQLRTGIESLLIRPVWQIDGMLAIRQSYPLPATVLAVVPWVVLGDDGG
jgi:hypothetical protein